MDNKQSLVFNSESLDLKY